MSTTGFNHIEKLYISHFGAINKRGVSFSDWVKVAWYCIVIYLFAFPLLVILMAISKFGCKLALKSLKSKSAKPTEKAILSYQKSYTTLTDSVNKMYDWAPILGSKTVIKRHEELIDLIQQVIILSQNKLPLESIYTPEELAEMDAYWKRYKETNEESYKLLHS